MSVHAVRLVCSDLGKIDYSYFGAYRLRVEVAEVAGPELVDAEGDPDPNLFIYQRREPSPYAGVVTPDIFAAVAGPSQLGDIPAIEPRHDHGWPFFRLHYVELDFMAKSQAEDVQNIIRDEIRRLAEFLDKAATLRTTSDIWFPAIPE